MKELHVWMSEPDYPIDTDYASTKASIMTGEKRIDTTQTHFLQFHYGYNLFVHISGDDVTGHEITLGECEGTNREIKHGYNIEKMLYAGEFNWFIG